jgi:hypothetical protein
VLALFAGLVLLPVLRDLENQCLPNWDLGIYAQALARLGPGDWNPFLSVRGLHIFNDHFDPVLIGVAPLARVVHPALAAILIEAAFLLLAAWMVAGSVHRAGGSPALVAAATALLVFGAGPVKGMLFPAHPTAWAVLPLVGFAVLWARGRIGWATACAVSLLLFKEEFVFSLLCLAILCWRRCRPAALTLLAAALAWGLFVFVLRARWVGPTEHYGLALLKPWLLHPVHASLTRLGDRPAWRDLLHLTLPFVPLTVWLWRARERILWAPLALLAPLALIRLLSGKWGAHYGVVVTACLLMAVLPALVRREPPRWVLASALVLLVAVQAQNVGRRAWGSLSGTRAACPADPQRLAELAAADLRVRALAQEPLYAAGNLVPALVQLPHIRHLGSATPPASGSFVVLLERAPTGSTWPSRREALDAQLAGWERQGRLTALMEGRFVRLLRVAPAPLPRPAP